VASVGLRLMELPEPLKGNAEPPLLLDSLMLAPLSAFRRGASGVGQLSSGRVPGRADGTAGDSHHGELGRTTEFHGAIAARSDDAAADAVFEAQGMEVHQQADAKMAHAEVGGKLGFMGGENGGDAGAWQLPGGGDHRRS
jgi:hypothetical protein